ncbi:hypothetical protein D3C81_1578880 [compost metagenome]
MRRDFAPGPEQRRVQRPAQDQQRRQVLRLFHLDLQHVAAQAQVLADDVGIEVVEALECVDLGGGVRRLGRLGQPCRVRRCRWPCCRRVPHGVHREQVGIRRGVRSACRGIRDGSRNRSCRLLHWLDQPLIDQRVHGIGPDAHACHLRQQVLPAAFAVDHQQQRAQLVVQLARARPDLVLSRIRLAVDRIDHVSRSLVMPAVRASIPFFGGGRLSPFDKERPARGLPGLET